MKLPSRDILRIIDANLNRIGEGLRVLEEYARLSLNDPSLTQQLKNMRHALLNIDKTLQERLLQARDAAADVGARMDVPGEKKERDVSQSIIANSRRVQESLRVMEEMSKDPDISLDSEKYRQSRFSLYTLEKELLSRLSRGEKVGRLPGLYVIIDIGYLKGRNPIDAAEQAIRGGASVIQLRDKERSPGDFLKTALALKKLCAEKKVLYIINDSLDITLASNADGLHVGQDDLPASVARRLLPGDKILGCSAGSVAEANKAKADGADYLGAGAVFSTATKDDAGKAIGTEKLREICRSVDLPVVAIGGINKDNLKEVLQAGAVAAAVISAVLGAEDVEKSTAQMVKIVRGGKT